MNKGERYFSDKTDVTHSIRDFFILCGELGRKPNEEVEDILCDAGVKLTIDEKDLEIERLKEEVTALEHECGNGLNKKYVMSLYEANCKWIDGEERIKVLEEALEWVIEVGESDPELPIYDEYFINAKKALNRK